MAKVRCNTKKYIDSTFGECGKDGKWKHPRYEEGIFCDGCKENVASFISSGWSSIKEDNDE